MFRQALLDELAFVFRQLTAVQPVATIEFPDLVEDFPSIIRGEFRKFSDDLCLTHAVTLPEFAFFASANQEESEM